MTTNLVQAIDGAVNWKLTPGQRHAIFDVESKILALEMGYQIHAKELAICKAAIQRQRAMICQLLGMINNLKADQVEHLESVALLAHDLEWHNHDDDFQELKEQIEKLGKECKFQSAQIYALEKLGNKESDRLDAVEKRLDSAPPKRTRKTTTK